MNTKKEVNNTGVMSLHSGHHLLRTLVKHTTDQQQVNADDDKFLDEYNIVEKNQQLKQVRNQYGARSCSKSLNGPLPLKRKQMTIMNNANFGFPKEQILTKFVSD